MAENKKRLLNEIKIKLVNSQLDQAMALICQAAGIPLSASEAVSPEIVSQKLYAAAHNPAVHDMYVLYRAFRAAHDAFDDESGINPYLAEKTQKYMAEILPETSGGEKVAVNYWLGRCAKYLDPENEQKAAAYFKAAIAASPAKNNSIYLRLASRELYVSPVQAREKLKYMEMGYRKLAVPGDVEVYERCMDFLRRKAYDEYTAEARLPETSYERREECFQQAVSLLDKIKMDKREKAFHRKAVYHAMYVMYSGHGDVQKAGEVHRKKMAAHAVLNSLWKKKWDIALMTAESTAD